MDPLELIRKAIIALVIATVILYLGVAVVAFKTYSTADTNTHALCALRGDLETRIIQSNVFLAQHPNGIPGISSQDIRTSLVNQQRTVKALGGIPCK